MAYRSSHSAPFKVPRSQVLLLICTLLLLGLGVAQAREALKEEQSFRRSLGRVKVLPPEGRPEITQESIDLALEVYGIMIPRSADHPRLDPDLADRGLTSRGAFMEKAEVTIGPAAFASWSLLGSTLAHELEVHCIQNFFFIYLMDLVGLDGTGEAERQAYIHELRNAKRFGLEIADADLIAETMEYYYPDAPRSLSANAGLPRTLRKWLARNFLQGQLDQVR